MIAEFALRSAPGRREVREDKCDELRLGELNGNRRRSWAFCHIAHRKWVDVKPERSSPESLTIAYNTKGYGTRKTRNHLNFKLSRLSWSTVRQPISFISRSISARRFPSALS